MVPLKKCERVPNIYFRDHKIVWKCYFCKEVYPYKDSFSDYIFETPYVRYNLWFFYFTKHLPLYGDFVFQVIIKCSRYLKYVSKALRCECHSWSIAFIYLIANARRNERSEIFLIEKYLFKLLNACFRGAQLRLRILNTTQRVLHNLRYFGSSFLKVLFPLSLKSLDFSWASYVPRALIINGFFVV